MTLDGKMPTDKRVIRRYFARSLETYCSAAAVQKKMAGQLALGWGRKRYPLIVELGAGAGFLSDEIVRHLDYDRLKESPEKLDGDPVLRLAADLLTMKAAVRPVEQSPAR